MKKESSFAKTIDSLGNINEFLEEFIEEVGLGGKQAYTLNLAAEEIFTNTIKYAPESTNDVKFELLEMEKCISLRIIDFEVARFDIGAVSRVDANSRPESITPGGYGLHLIQNMADDFSYDYSDGTATYTVTININ